MNYLFLALLAPCCIATTGEDIGPLGHTGNGTIPDKDVYVIHATVYEVGILTNQTDIKTSNQTTGSQESVTFFRTNGSHVDLGGISKPLLTNVTAQSMLGVAPVPNGTRTLGGWTTLSQPSLPKPGTSNEFQNSSLDTSKFLRKLFKRSLNGTTPVKVVTGTAVIPPGVGLQSISLPPLLTLNNNLSGIPVPIPNTVVVNYAKVNTLDKKQIQRIYLSDTAVMSSPKLSERCHSTMSNGKKLLSNDSKEDSLDNSLRESMKSERQGKNEEDWRRRTIIVVKINGSYGFTLQSYGIHYKKEQEIEVITYVDHVEEEGAAAAAGMREGDVILSINGADVEHADHATVVDAINGCDSRMRMVVIFEDCVRKVELHLKYINIQRTIQNKMRELEQLTVRERQLFDTNWKTHSLPSQKKKSSPSDVISDSEENVNGENMNKAYSRPTLSSENVAGAKPPQPNVFMYQYLDPRYGTCLIQPNLRTGSFVITVGSPRNRRDCHHYVVKTQQGECHRASEAHKAPAVKHTKGHRNNHSHSCAPCMPAYNNQDANSLEAYDLASPCCDPHCVPNSRKKVRRKKECSKEHKRKDKSQVDRSTQKPDSVSGPQTRTKKVCPSGHCSSRYRYLTAESTQTSQCSLQSYATSNATVQCDNSASSYSTSLSSDTLFWDTDRSESKTSPKIQYHSSHQHAKPKSWDNLTTKAFGGYGFGYGYLDTTDKQANSNRSKSHGRSHSGRTVQAHHEYQQQHSQDKHGHRHNGTGHNHYSVYSRSHSHCAPNKSTESLIMVPKYQLESSGSESRLACDCAVDSVEYFRRISTAKSPADTHANAYYAQYFYPTHSYKKNDSNVSSEITRL